MVVDRATACGGRAANLQNQTGNALDVRDGLTRVHAPLKAVTGVGGKIEATRAASDRAGPPKRCLYVNAVRAVGHCTGRAAHDAGQRFKLNIVGDDADFIVHFGGIAVEQFELFARLAPAHRQATGDFLEVKNMGGLAGLEHHVIGDIHQGAHTALAATGQAVDHPSRRFGLRVELANHAARETAT